MKNFFLIKDEEDEVDLRCMGEGLKESKENRCVVGRVLSGKPFNRCALSGALQGAWKLLKGFKLHEVGDNLFICEFGSKA